MSQAARQRLYRLLAIGRRDCAWADGYYRQRLAAHGATERNGHISAKTMSLAQMEAVLTEMKGEGFAPRRARKGTGPGTALNVAEWRRRQIGKLNAIWCLLADDGHVRNRAEQAMHAWCQHKVPGLSRLEWAEPAQLNRAVEELKRWAQRLGYREDRHGYLVRGNAA